MEGDVPGLDVALPDAGAQQEFPTDIRSWAHEDDARSRIAAMDPGERFGSVLHPFRTIPHEEYRAAIQGAGIPARSLTAPIALVNLADLVAIQGSINPERLAAHLDDPYLIPEGTRSPGHGMLIDRPVVVRKDGVLLIHDGHHRLTARHLRGATTAKVRFVDLDAQDTTAPP